MEVGTKLTSKKYWEGYYKKNRTSKKQIIDVCSYYDKYWEILICRNSKNKTIIEIGGYPGRYLAYLSSKYDLTPTCLDFNSDFVQIEQSFKVMGVANYNIINEDFTKYQPNKQYDFVLSNGFIEHFKNFDEILDIHINYVNPGGRLLIMIPNMKGYIKLYKCLVDYNNLKHHNLDCMSLNVFKKFAKRNNLREIELSYFGGFPISVHQKLNLIQKLFYKINRVILKNLLGNLLLKYPSKYYSTGIIAVFEK